MNKSELENYAKFGKAVWDFMIETESVFELTDDNTVAEMAVDADLAEKFEFNSEFHTLEKLDEMNILGIKKKYRLMFTSDIGDGDEVYVLGGE